MKNVEDLYPLSPLQEGLLAHALAAPESGVAFEQLSCTLEGELDTAAFQKAWQRLVDRHPILRTAFVSAKLKRPLQVVHREVRLPFMLRDDRALPAEGQRSKLELYLAEDRRRGFDPAQAPLMRMALLRIRDDAYTFVWSHHHLLLDGWCKSLVLGEVLTLYEAFRQGRPEPPLPLSPPYRSYIAWLQEQDLSQAEAFWRGMFDGHSGALPALEVDRLPRPRGPEGARYASRELQLPDALDLELSRFAQTHGVTLNTLVQGLWALLLSRYSARRTVVFGTVVSGRPADLPGAESIIGMFINNLPVRAQVPADARLLPWLEAMQALFAEIRQYEYSSPAQVQQWSGLTRARRLFETLVLFQNYPTGEASTDGPEHALKIRSYRSRLETNYPLTFLVSPRQTLTLKIHFDRHRFDGASIQRMLGHVARLARAMVGEPEQRLSALSWMSRVERQQLLQEWNDCLEPSSLEPVSHHLERQAAAAPDAIAVVGDQHFSFGELGRRSSGLAARLVDQGVGRMSRVGLSLPRSPELVIGLLAAWRVGAAVSWLPESRSPGAVSRLLSDSGVSALVTSSDRMEDLSQAPWQVFMLDGTADGSWGDCRPVVLDAEDLAWISLSRDRDRTPEHVGLSHGGLGRVVGAAVRQLRLEPSDRTVASATPGSDRALLELLVPLSVGARLVIQGEDAPPALAGSSVRGATPSEWQRALDAGGWGGPRYVVWSSGEPLPRGLADRLRRASAGVCDFYGSREAGTWSVPHHVASAPSVAVREPASGTRLHLTRGLSLVPIGVTGEVCLCGETLARGYLDRPRLTAERFLPDPFSERSGGRLLRTGDRGRRLPDGGVELLGRIEACPPGASELCDSAEVEAALRRLPKVSMAAVEVVDEGEGRRRSVAYLVPGTAELDVNEVRRGLRRALPGVAIPRQFVRIDNWPVADDGTVDRHELTEMASAEISWRGELVAPRDPLEVRLLRIWEDLLDSGQEIGVTDNFFELGGNSILAVRLIAEIRSRLGVELPLPTLISSGTIASLARHMESQAESPIAWAPRVALQSDGSGTPLFVVHPAGGSVLRYVDLADRLGKGQPVHGLQALGHEEGQEPFDRLEDMAAFYLEAVRAEQPQGPYRLAGWSFGGLVAFEMAQQLRRAGESTRLLAMLDAAAGAPAWAHLPDRDPHPAERLARLLGGALPVPLAELEGMEDGRELVAFLIEKARAAGTLPADFDEAQAQRYYATLEAHSRAHRSYRPAPYAGRIELFRAESGLGTVLEDPTLGWGSVAADGVGIHHIPGDHHGFLAPPHVSALADRLRRLLAPHDGTDVASLVTQH
ncbi:MAG: condensation domain-containing protein [Acidobacteriota bacterium]